MDGVTCWQPHPSEMNNLKFKVPPYFCLVRSVLTSKANSSASASSSSVILTEGDLYNRPVLVRAESRLKYRAICRSVNQSVLENIFWPVVSWTLHFGGHIRGSCLLTSFLPCPERDRWEIIFCSMKKGNCFSRFLKGPSKIHLGNKGLFFRILSWGLTVNLATTYEMDSLYPFLLDLVVGEFFCQP